MMRYVPETMVVTSRYQHYFSELPVSVQQDVYARIRELLAEEAQWCDRRNYRHMSLILTLIALYEVLQRHGASGDEAYRIVSEQMWAALDPSGMQKLARLLFFMPLMRRVVPFGFKHGSGTGWRYTWHRDDPKGEFRFECNECIYHKILGARGLLELGAVCCRCDVINYGELPYTDFIRTGTLCQGSEVCDFRFVRHATDAGDGWERSHSV